MQYFMPAEWEPHAGTWLAWPHNKEHWPGNFSPIPAVFEELARALLDAGEKVFVCVNDAKMEEEARRVIKNSDNLQFFHIPTDSSWTRDIGPIFVRDAQGKLSATNWIFNCWGKKYPPWDTDDKVAGRIGQALKLPVISPGIVLEGGSIEVNGKGTLLTTKQCLLNKNRNPHLNKTQIEKYLHDYLGATNVLWLKEGIFGDETDGHIDEVARFTDAHTIVASMEENSTDPNHAILKKNFEDLQKMHDHDGKPFNIIPLPMPAPLFYQNQRLPVSYTNFYIANKAVLVPIFRCPQDQKALEILAPLFPGRKIIPIDCVDLAWGLGTIHCSTQQQPSF